MILKEKAVCFTGHRKMPPEKLKDISKQLKETFIQLSSVCVCYWTETTGGTAYTVKYASTKELRIENVAEK